MKKKVCISLALLVILVLGLFVASILGEITGERIAREGVYTAYCRQIALREYAYTDGKWDKDGCYIELIGLPGHPKKYIAPLPLPYK